MSYCDWDQSSELHTRYHDIEWGAGHPAGGNEFTSVKISPDELEKASDAIGWCDVCKGWENEEGAL